MQKIASFKAKQVIEKAKRFEFENKEIPGEEQKGSGHWRVGG